MTRPGDAVTHLDVTATTGGKATIETTVLTRQGRSDTRTHLAPWEIRSAILTTRAVAMIGTANDETLPLRPFERAVLRKVGDRLQALAQMLVRRHLEGDEP